MRKRKIRTPAQTFDEPWKQIVRALFPQFIEFFLPPLFGEIDWQRKPEFLDTELRRISYRIKGNRRNTADFLVKVWRLDGAEQIFIIHVELQAQKQTIFPMRMFLYNVRGFDRYRCPVISLAVLADLDANWRPDRFAYGAPGFENQFVYAMKKLLDFADRQSELEASDNPFALTVPAHLKTQETRGDNDGGERGVVQTLQ